MDSFLILSYVNWLFTMIFILFSIYFNQEKLAELESKMVEFYSKEDQLVLEGDPLVGHYYAAKSGSDWLRALVEDVYDGLVSSPLAL